MSCFSRICAGFRALNCTASLFVQAPHHSKFWTQGTSLWFHSGWFCTDNWKQHWYSEKSSVTLSRSLHVSAHFSSLDLFVWEPGSFWFPTSFYLVFSYFWFETKAYVLECRFYFDFFSRIFCCWSSSFFAVKALLYLLTRSSSAITHQRSQWALTFHPFLIGLRSCSRSLVARDHLESRLELAHQNFLDTIIQVLQD